MTDQPDFDSMSPEELMAWMESLAKRQGAHEGFTTSADMQVAEIDPSTVEVDEPGYIPYGMDAEKWAQKQAEEARRKAERTPAPPPPPAAMPPPVTAPPPAAPPPTVTAPPAAASAQPDFDAMTPEQLMAWMESLAKRQGVDAEQLTTSADMQVAEIDPSTVELDEPGYIPYGMDPEKWAQKQAEEARLKAERTMRPTAIRIPLTPPPSAAPPQLELFAADHVPEESTRTTPITENPLAWLESLSADQGNADLGALDLSGLDAVLPEPIPSATSSDDPLAWLESLSQGQGSIPGLEQFDLGSPEPAQTAAPPAPATDNPLEWLESLARRQGADAEELTTSAALNIPLPDASQINAGPGYTEYTFESDNGGSDDISLDFFDADDETFEMDDTDDTGDWLTALAAGQAADVPPLIPDTQDSPDVQQALATGQELPPEAIKNWMDQLLEQGAARSDVPDYVDEVDEQLVPAQLPDWLLEQVGPPPEATGLPSLPGTKPLMDQIVEPPAVEMPDWLKEDIEDTEAVDFDSIFAAPDEPTPVAATAAPPPPAPAPTISKISTSELQMDADDPWVEAFEFERIHSQEELDEVPDWYAEKLRALGHDAGAEAVQPVPAAVGAGIALAAADLGDEHELPAGALQPVPAWLSLDAALVAAAPAYTPSPAADPLLETSEEAIIAPSVPDWLRDQIPVEEEAVVTSDLPDWLRAAGVDTEDEIEIPAWLTETLDTGETPAVDFTPEQPPAPVAPVPAYTPPPAPVSPAPVPVVASNVNVPELLQTARTSFSSGFIEQALQAYEAVVRANTALDVVIADLGSAIKSEAHKSNPAVYRVLGDSLMRQGQLQQALDTYRKALNLL